MAEPDETRTPSVRSCPECGVAVQPGQRRCTNCGASVERRRRLTRRTPLVAALAVLAVGAGAVVVAQAAVTDKASQDASAPADPASAPVAVAGAPIPAPDKETSTPPKAVEVAPPPTTTTPIEIPKLNSDVVGEANDERDKSKSDKKDGENLPEDGKSDPDDLQDQKKLKVKKAINYDPFLRAGVEFGEPKAAIDKRQRTVWDVNVPADGQGINVGIVLDLGSTKHVSSLRIQTPTPGFGAVMLRADTKDMPSTLLDQAWTKAAAVEKVSDDVVVPLSDEPEWARFICVWITTGVSEDDTRVAISNLEVLP